MIKKEIRLYSNKEECSGCGACLNICGHNAITMEEDEMGFLYPKIDTEKCIGCEMCKRVCNYQNGQLPEKTELAYIAVAKANNTLKNSASGGVFGAIAKEILKNDGVVYGCSLEQEQSGLHVKHIRVNDIDSLVKLQGSKYVQSSIGTIYKDVKEDLKNNRLVLFSGTPCQIDGLKGFLGRERFPNLLTIDLVCHGVPNEKMFCDYLKMFEKKLRGKIVNFSFRDKNEGWGYKGFVEYIDKRGKVKKRKVPVSLSSYYKLFLDSEICRENCYQCKYAGLQRVGDITIGDFWGIEEEHPEVLSQNGGKINIEKGVSCILVNTDKGAKMIEKFGNGLLKIQSSSKKVARYNRQLNYPSKPSSNRKKIFDLYKENGYEAVQKWYYDSLGWKRYASECKYLLLRMIKKK